MKKIQALEDNIITQRGAQFAQCLLHWNEQDNNRQMPWKGEKDPYRIWLSEIILQQTRVEQGMPYFKNFVAAYPTIQALAAAPDDEVFKLWEGLGYYSRCRNLLAAARHIADELNGIFPDTYEDIFALKGVGPYTAAAIASFAYNEPYAVLDGNVYRVLARIHGIDTPTDSTEGKKVFTQLAQQQLPADQAAAYNQGIMDFGAVVCKPLPECATCFFKNSCIAFIEGRQLALPVKEKKTIISERYFFYLVLECNDKVSIRQRKVKDIWQSLYEFLLLETPEQASWQMISDEAQKAWNLKPEHYKRKGTRYQLKQRLTHQLVYFSFERLQLQHQIAIPGMQWIDKTSLAKYPFPKTLKQYIDEELTPA